MDITKKVKSPFFILFIRKCPLLFEHQQIKSAFMIIQGNEIALVVHIFDQLCVIPFSAIAKLKTTHIQTQVDAYN